MNDYAYDTQFAAWTIATTPGADIDIDRDASMQPPSEAENSKTPPSSHHHHRRQPTYYPPLSGPPPLLPYTTAPPIGSRPRYSEGTPYPDLSLSLSNPPSGPDAQRREDPPMSVNGNGNGNAQAQAPDPRSPTAAEATVSLSQLLHDGAYASGPSGTW